MTDGSAEERERIVAAAHRSFLARGYLLTTIGDIAADAEVELRSVYSAFGSKVGVLSAVQDEAVVGDAQPVPLLDRDWVTELADLEPAAALHSVVTNVAAAVERASPVHQVVSGAASDPGVGELLDLLHAQRTETCRRLAELVAPAPELVDQLADTLYGVLSLETYHLLVVRRGWSRSRWEAWAERCLTAGLAAP
ncbi:TetR/AcrR family transcriptional regulator [Solicola sp. PLA-1-18]|uniref:TetR/AcrR family transcriptional regulator n=1 Tax=Solicola sp. PLA-1-18 TaxID=3380532 RepID=UPI003B819945